MVAFDASAPNPISEPNWLGWSKSITQPQPDKSGEILGKMVGTAVEETGKIASNIAEGQFQQGAEDILRGEITKLQDFQSGNSNESLVQANANELPSEVTGVQNAASTLQSARANGAISPTYYYGQLDKYASDMRSKYPMFQKQIDQGIAKATGVTHTANELYQSTMRDINSFLTKKDDIKNKLIGEALQNTGSPNAPRVLKGLMNGTMGNDEAIDLLHQDQAFKYGIDQQNAAIANEKARRENTAASAEATFTTLAHNHMASILVDVSKQFGLTPSEVQDYIFHPERIKSSDMADIAQKHEAIKTQVRQRLEDLANQPNVYYDPVQKKNVVGDSYASLMPDKYSAVIDRTMKTLDAQTNMIKDSQIGALDYWSNQEKALRQDTTMSLLAEKSGIAGPMMTIDALKRFGMDKAALDMVQDQLKVDTPKVRAFVDSMRGRAFLTPEQAKVFHMKPSESLADDINFLYNNGMNNSEIKGKFVQDLHHITESDFPDAQKAALILHTFGPKNVGNLSAWQRNGVQPDGSVSSAPDRWNILGAMTDPQITKEVRRLDADPRFAKLQLWDNYKSTTNTMIRTEFQKQILDLNTYDAAHNVIYDSDKHEFRYVGISGLGQTSTGAATAPRTGIRGENHPVQKLLDKLNVGLHTMADIATAEGRNPDAVIYDTMKDMGYKWEDNPKTTGSGMMNSIISMHAADKKKYDDQLNKMIEDVKGLGKKKNP